MYWSRPKSEKEKRGWLASNCNSPGKHDSAQFCFKLLWFYVLDGFAMTSIQSHIGMISLLHFQTQSTNAGRQTPTLCSVPEQQGACMKGASLHAGLTSSRKLMDSASKHQELCFASHKDFAHKDSVTVVSDCPLRETTAVLGTLVHSQQWNYPSCTCWVGVSPQPATLFERAVLSQNQFGCSFQYGER